MAAVDRSSEPPLGRGRAVLLAWIVVTALLLLELPDATAYYRITAIGALVVAAVGIVCFVRDRFRHAGRIAGRNPPRTRARTHPPEPLDGLRRHSGDVANRVQLVLDLLDGPLRGQLDGAQVSAARQAINSSLTDLDSLEKTATAVQQALTTLQRTLQLSDVTPSTDPDWRALRDRLAELKAKQAAVVRDLDQASRSVQAAWAPVEQDMLRQLRAGELAKARDDAERVAAESVAADSAPNTAAERLSDAVDEIRARLGGVGEVGSINHRILGPEDMGTDDPGRGRS